MKKALALFLGLFMMLFSLTSCTDYGELGVMFFRKVAREMHDDGWVYSFIYEDFKSEHIDDSDVVKYRFNGINLRYKHQNGYTETVTSPNSTTGETYIQVIAPAILVFGQGSAKQAEEIEYINSVLFSSDKTVDELLALNPDDYDFETIDKDMVFRLMRQALTGEAHPENPNHDYWENPSHAFMLEPSYADGYKFQVAYVQATGYVDEIFIDVLYKTGDGYNDYRQLSDMIDDGTATDEQQQAFDLIRQVVADVKETKVYIGKPEVYQNEKIADIDFSRLYTFLNNVHEGRFDQYSYEQIEVLATDVIKQ